jgi:hypothetical protein
MAFKLGTTCAEGSFCFIAILISVFAATLGAQTSGDNDAYPFSSSRPDVVSRVERVTQSAYAR